MKLGWKGKIYYATAGTSPVPGTDDELDNISDVTLELAKSEHDVTTRASAGYKESAAGLIAVGISMKMRTDRANANYTAIKAAFLADTTISVLMLDEASGEGPDGDCKVFDFGREEPIDGVMWTNVVLKPTASTRAFGWHSASA